MSALNMISIEI